jgi:hypothetical protein
MWWFSSHLSSLWWRSRELRSEIRVFLEDFFHLLLILHFFNSGESHGPLSLIEHGFGNFSLNFGIEILEVVFLRVDLSDIDFGFSLDDVFPPALELREFLNSEVQGLAGAFIGFDGPETISGLGESFLR